MTGQELVDAISKYGLLDKTIDPYARDEYEDCVLVFEGPHDDEPNEEGEYSFTDIILHSDGTIEMAMWIDDIIQEYTATFFLSIVSGP